MFISKVCSTAGILVELVGFVILASELLRTNADVVRYATSLAGKVTNATSIIGYDGPDGHLEIQGGSVGELAPAAARLAKQVAEGARMTWLGLGLTALGVLGQFIGTILG
jgi:hypothetical protein